MATFKDSEGGEWVVEFDAFLLDDIKTEIDLDLGDLSASAWHAIETHSPTVVKVLAVACSDECKTRSLTDRQFSKLIISEAIERGRQALLAAAKDFFPLSEWSAMESYLTKRKSGQEMMTEAKLLTENKELLPMLAEVLSLIEQMPPDMKAGAMAEIEKQVTDAGGDISDLERLAASGSVSAQDSQPLNAATDLPVNVESLPEE